jgi:hypothetical protein
MPLWQGRHVARKTNAFVRVAEVHVPAATLFFFPPLHPSCALILGHVDTDLYGHHGHRTLMNTTKARNGVVFCLYDLVCSYYKLFNLTMDVASCQFCPQIVR